MTLRMLINQLLKLETNRLTCRKIYAQVQAKTSTPLGHSREPIPLALKA